MKQLHNITLKQQDHQHWGLYWPSGEPLKCICGRDINAVLLDVPAGQTFPTCCTIEVQDEDGE